MPDSASQIIEFISELHLSGREISNFAIVHNSTIKFLIMCIGIPVASFSKCQHP